METREASVRGELLVYLVEQWRRSDLRELREEVIGSLMVHLIQFSTIEGASL